MRSAPVRPGSEWLASTPLRRKLGKHEQRSSVRLYKSWDEARGWDRVPRLQDFDLGTLEELGGSCFLLVDGEEGAASRFRYFGRELAKEIGRDLTGRSISDVPRSSLLSHVLEHHLEVTQRQRPVGVNGRFHAPRSDLLYRGILLPFSSDYDEVDAVLGCYRWRAETRREDIPETGKLSEIHHAVQAIQSFMHWLAVPAPAAEAARRATPLGRAIVPIGPGPEFVLLLARRVGPMPHQFEVISTTGSVLLDLALRSAARRTAARSAQQVRNV